MHTFAVGAGNYVVHNCDGVDLSNPQIADSKLVYLTTHQEQDDKSVGFSQLGYTSENRGELRELLRGQASDVDLNNPATVTQYGTKYSVTNVITGPNGRQGEVQSIWQVDHGSYTIRFITAMARPF